MSLEIHYLISKTYVISPLTPALSPLRGEGEFFAVDSPCFATKSGSRVQCANCISGKSLPVERRGDCIRPMRGLPGIGRAIPSSAVKEGGGQCPSGFDIEGVTVRVLRTGSRFEPANLIASVCLGILKISVSVLSQFPLLSTRRGAGVRSEITQIVENQLPFLRSMVSASIAPTLRSCSGANVAESFSN
jgi:hypothetical protein